MSLHGIALFKRKHNTFKAAVSTSREVWWDLEIRIREVWQVRKVSRRTCRIRDVFYTYNFGEYCYDTDAPQFPDREQSYNLGRMEIFN